MSKSAWVSLIGAVILLLAAAAYFAIPHLMKVVNYPVGPILLYEIDPKSVADIKKVDMADLVAKVDIRLNSNAKTAHVKQLPKYRIEVTLVSDDDAVVQNVKRLLECDGALEFRVLANTHDDKALIDRALADPSKTKILDDKGNWLARWVPVRPDEVETLASHHDIALRKTKVDGRESTEVLVDNDEYDQTGTYIKRARTNRDATGRPCVDVEFDKFGAELLGLITVSHQPDQATSFKYKLGIIIDGQLQAAPNIQATLNDRAQITGRFTSLQAENLAAVLTSGKLPAHLKPVAERTPEKKK